MPSSKQRRAAELRRLQRQRDRRREQAAARRRATLIASIIGTLVVIAVVIFFITQTGSDHTPSAAKHTTPARSTAPAATPTPTPSETPTRTATYPCTWTKSGAASRPVQLPPTTKPAKSGTVTVAMKTTRGAVTLQLNRAAAPCTVASFLSLVQQKYYDNTPCPRVTTSGIFVLQCGDPKGDGTGGPGYTIPDEATGAEHYPAGTLAMARSQTPHSGGSQFFIVYKDSPTLEQHLGQQQYTVFGKVTSGLKVITAVAAKGSDNSNPAGGGHPKLPISISSITLAK